MLTNRQRRHQALGYRSPEEFEQLGGDSSSTCLFFRGHPNLTPFLRFNATRVCTPDADNFRYSPARVGTQLLHFDPGHLDRIGRSCRSPDRGGSQALGSQQGQPSCHSYRARRWRSCVGLSLGSTRLRVTTWENRHTLENNQVSGLWVLLPGHSIHAHVVPLVHAVSWTNL